MIANLLHGDIPPLHGVALRAVRTHFAAVDVGVAIGAVLAHVREYRFHVALRALHLFMQATKRIFRLVVIEFGDCTNWAPTCRGVAIFARNVQWPVGIPLRVLLGIAAVGCRGYGTVGRDVRDGTGKRQQSPERGLEQCERIVLPPRDTNTCRGGTVEIIDALWRDCRVLTTVQPYSCRTVAYSFPRDNRYCQPSWGLGFSLRSGRKWLPRGSILAE